MSLGVILLQCCVNGIPSVTSNLSGFSGYIEKYLSNPEDHGIYIIDRKNRSFGECKSQLANAMWRFANQSLRQRIEQRNRTEKLTEILDWDTMYRQYCKARSLALKRVFNCELSIPDFLKNKSEF